MQNAKPDYAKDPEVPKNVPIQDANDARVKEVQNALDAEKKKRRSRPLLAALLSLLLIVVGAVAAICVYQTYLEPKTTTKNQPAKTVDTPAEQQIKPIDKILGLVKPKLSNPATLQAAPGDHALLAVQVPGYDYRTDLFDATLQKGITGEIAAADNKVKLAEISKIFIDNGYREDARDDGTGQSYEARYYGADAACFVGSLGSQDSPSAAHAIRVACSTMQDFKKVAAAQKPFVDAEAVASAIEYANETAWYGLPIIKDSTTSGYKTATLMLAPANAAAGGSELLFYQAPNSGWHYATRMGGLGPQPTCDSFTSGDAKKAYAGTTCYNDTAKSTAKP